MHGLRQCREIYFMYVCWLKRITLNMLKALIRGSESAQAQFVINQLFVKNLKLK